MAIKNQTNIFFRFLRYSIYIYILTQNTVVCLTPKTVGTKYDVLFKNRRIVKKKKKIFALFYYELGARVVKES